MQSLRIKQEDSSIGMVMKQKLFAKILPLSLLGVLLVTALVTVFTQADQYGITIDEPEEDAYGQLSLAWYNTLGKDTSFLTAFPKSSIQLHGAIFEVIVAEAQHIFAQPWHTRAVVNGLAAFVGVVAIALCGLELGGWWAAFLAALNLWLYPRFFGAMFNNSRDIPFTSVMLLVLWAVLILVHQWEMQRKFIINSILLGFFIGFAAAVRVNAILWYVILMLLLAGWWMHYGLRVFRKKQVMANLGKQASAAVIIAALSLLTMTALWPYIALNPLHNLYDAIMVLRNYPWNDWVPFAGRMYHANNLPRPYAPIWLMIGSPPAVVIFAGIGGLFACAVLFKRKMIDTKIAVVSLALILPLGLMVALRVTLYDGMRHFLFLVPPLILLAVYGFMSSFTYLARKKQILAVAGLVLLALVSQVQVIKDMNDLHPYEYMYFSPLVGGVPGANGKYDMDYWGVCNKPAAEWLAHNYQKYTNNPSPTVMAPYTDELVIPYLPAVFQPGGNNPDFYISITRLGKDKLFPSYKVIHTEGVQGYVACVVKVKPSSPAEKSTH